MVPVAYHDLYLMLRRQVQEFRARVFDGWDGTPYSGTCFSAELVPADNYKNLLSSQYYSGSVLPYLDRLSQIHCRGVKFQLGFPILYEPFWSGWVVPHGYDQNRFAAYRQRYAQLISDIHARGMKVIAQSQHMEIGRGESWNVDAYFASLTWDSYKAGRQSNVVEMARNLGLAPDDFLILQSEPDNENANVSQPNLLQVPENTAMIAGFLAELDLQAAHTMVVGAGCGSWYSQYVQQARAFCDLLRLDLFDVHLYPINETPVGGSHWERAIWLLDTASTAGKSLGMSESWLHKARDSELGVLDYSIIDSRSHYGFFEPLDIDLRSVLVRLAQWKHLAFQSASLSRQLFAYVDYNQAPTATPQELENLQNQATASAIAAGSYSMGGLEYSDLIAGAS